MGHGSPVRAPMPIKSAHRKMRLSVCRPRRTRRALDRAPKRRRGDLPPMRRRHIFSELPIRHNRSARTSQAVECAAAKEWMGTNQGPPRTRSTSPPRPPPETRSEDGPTEPSYVGRFEVLELLGRGTRGEVYLARDPGRGNKVAIRLFTAGWEPPAELDRQSQTLSQLQHPNLAAVLEIGEHQGRPCVVYEYAPGQSLKRYLRENGPLPVRKAARWMTRILDAVAHAHEKSTLHLDLTPASIQVDGDGSLKVLDFGVSLLANGPSALGDPLGGAYYMAPEILHGRTGAAPASDIFSLGLILHEMVTGSPAVSGNDPVATMQWMAHNTVAPPSARRAELDAEFDRVVQRALEKAPQNRYLSARQMQQALADYLAGKPPESQPVDDASALGFLLRRMRRRADFPAIAQNMSLIGKKTASDSESSVDELANIILKDYALTTKLLRLVNSSFYGQYGGQISTVSRAVVVLGLTQVRNAALSLLLFEHLGDKPQAYELREAAGLAFLSGNIGRRVAEALRISEPERAFVCAMLHNLGQYLTIFYFPEEHEEIQGAVRTEGVDAAAASRAILGLCPEELAIGVAREWRLPDEIIQSMRRLPAKVLGPPADEREALHYISSFANRLADIVIRPAKDAENDTVQALRKHFKAHIVLTDKQLSSIVQAALDDLSAHADVFNINLKTSRFFRNANKWVTKSTSAPAVARRQPANDAPSVAPDPETSGSDASSREAILLSGMQDITQAIVGDYALNDILVMILETLFRGLGFSRVLLCIRDAKRGKMAARFGLGRDLESLVNRFSFPLNSGPDVFSRAVQDHDDVVCHEPGKADDVPEWHRALVKPATFALYPIVVNEVTLGLIYADREEADKLVDHFDRNYLNALRNQAALAVKQRS